MKKNNLKRTLALATSAFALSAAFVGCTDYTEFSEADFQRDAKMKEYYNNFVKEFGEPDPNHTWGWGMTPEMADAILGNSLTTRAGSEDYNQPGRINVNRNEWCSKTNPYSLLNVYGVPGWPNWDGKYYTQEGSYTNGHYPIYETQLDNCNMPGDVTEFEILWVSNAIHYKQYTGNVDLHVSDYFIQQISTNADYKAENGKTADENYKLGNVFDYGDASHSYKDYSMNYLNAKSLVGDAWTHINNFNGNSNDKPNLHIGQNSGRNIIYVQSSGTERFNYHPTNSTDGKTFEKFILVHLEWDEPLDPEWSTKMGSNSLEDVLANPSAYFTTKKREGYYLCFDFQDEKEEYSGYSGDDIYDNWILKITPGYPIQKNRWPKRLMCEDLGNTYDFDFNDAVFDLSFAQNTTISNAYDMIVVIQAAGGTMPITVALPPDGNVDNIEIHNLLGGNPSTTPVNVIKGGAKAAPAMYRMKNVFTFDPSALSKINIGKDTNGDDILVPNYNSSETLLAQMAACAFTMEIHIKNGNNWTSVSGYDLYKGLRDNYNEGNKGTSAVPQLFNCSTDAKWTYENGHIKDAYKHFINWVQNEQCDYRLRWDENQYFYRDGQGQQPVLKQHEQSVIDSWKGSWDFGPKGSTTWGTSSEYIDTSKFWGGNGPE